MTRITSRRVVLTTGLALVLAAAFAAAAPGTKTITFADLMKFRAIGGPVISEDGTVVAYGLQPDRGDGEGVVHALVPGRVTKVPLGASPVISKDGRFVAMVVKVPFAQSEQTDRDRPKPGMALVDVSAGSVKTVENVERFAFSDDARWLTYQMPAPEPAAAGAPTRTSGAAAKAGEAASAAQASAPAAKAGGPLKLRNLADGTEQEIATRSEGRSEARRSCECGPGERTRSEGGRAAEAAQPGGRHRAGNRVRDGVRVRPGVAVPRFRRVDDRRKG
jgi:hypothetical protein